MAADIGTIQRLPKIIPAGIAREWTMMGEKISAERAKEVGLVSSLHESHEEMIDIAFEMAEKILKPQFILENGQTRIFNNSGLTYKVAVNMLANLIYENK